MPGYGYGRDVELVHVAIDGGPSIAERITATVCPSCGADWAKPGSVRLGHHAGREVLCWACMSTTEPSQRRSESWRSTHTVDGTWPAILDEATWNELLRTYTTGMPARRRPRYSLLAGTLRCAHCCAGLGWGESVSETASGRCATYWCLANSGGSGKLSVAADHVDEYVSQLVVGAVAANRDRLRPARPTGANTGTRHEERTRNRTNLARALGGGLLDYGTFEGLVKTIDDELAALADQTPDAVAAMEQGMRRAIAIAQAWDDADTDERREVVRTLIPRAWGYPVARGMQAPPQCRVAAQRVDESDLTVDAGRERLAALPTPPTAAERRAARNARDRAKRRAERATASAGPDPASGTG